jgi:hypothetical protein
MEIRRLMDREKTYRNVILAKILAYIQDIFTAKCITLLASRPILGRHGNGYVAVFILQIGTEHEFFICTEFIYILKRKIQK